jgi:hypothetical protein
MDGFDKQGYPNASQSLQANDSESGSYHQKPSSED